jgi:hypothetical protein
MSIKKIFNCLLIITAFVIPAVQAQNAADSPDKIIDKIVGTWKIQSILSGKNEVAKNPTSGQWIEFRSDGKYVHQTTMPDSGSYRIDENRSILFLESSVQAGSSKNSPKKINEWNLAFKDGTMTMRRNNNPNPKDKKQHKDNMSYVYVRIADGESVVKPNPK